MARPGLSIDFALGSDLAAGHLRFRMVGSRLPLLACPSYRFTNKPSRGVAAYALSISREAPANETRSAVFVRSAAAELLIGRHARHGDPEPD
jgi:hypothetical protein